MPSVIVLCVFAYLPMLGVSIAFPGLPANPGSGAPGGGVHNFKYIFGARIFTGL